MGDEGTQDRTTWFKEAVTAVIGAGIVVVTLVIAWRLYGARAEPPLWHQPPAAGGAQPAAAERIDPFERGKEVLTLLMPLAGAIVGYYTGRVIADKTIQQATNSAEQATRTAQQANQTAQTARQDRDAAITEAVNGLDELLEMAPAKPSALERMGAPDASKSAAQMRQSIEELRESLARRRGR